MANALKLPAYQEKNFRKLAAYCLSGKLKAEFHMGGYSDNPLDSTNETTCGTIGCAAGHGPYAGIPKSNTESWNQYIDRAFIPVEHQQSHSPLLLPIGVRMYIWCFSGLWDCIDNTPEGAGKRILYMLENGIPDNYTEQLQGIAPLIYK